MSEIKNLDPTARFLMGPGPSDVHPRVLKAMSTPMVGHMDPQFFEIMDGVKSMLRTLFKTKNDLTFAVSGTGSAGMEMCFDNLLEPGENFEITVDLTAMDGDITTYTTFVIEVKPSKGSVLTIERTTPGVVDDVMILN